MKDGCVELTVLGQHLLADPSGALFWPERKMLFVADLHFEKGSAFAAKGQMLPPYDTRSTLAALRGILAKHQPDKVVALGDSFHDEEAGDRISEPDFEAIRMLTEEFDWLWLSGNHDEVLPLGIGGTIMTERVVGPLVLRHEPSLDDGDGELAGHLHPAAVVRTRSRSLRRRCFVGDGRRLILPTFGAFTGGLDISDEAFAGLFVKAPTAWVLGRDRVYEIPPHRLAGVA